MKKIIVPTDFSDCALNAFKTAVQIAKKTNASIDVIHTYEKKVYGFVDLYVDHEANHHLKEAFEKEMKKLKSLEIAKDLEIHCYIIADKKIWELSESPEFSSADLIVMGTNGSTGAKDFFVGSNTEKVVKHTDIPVLTVHKEDVLFNPKNIVFASDFSKEIDSIFDQINNFAKLFDSKIHLLKVITPNSFESTYKSEYIIQDFANIFKLKNYTINTINDYSVEEGIQQFANKANADLIAMAAHKRTGLERLFFQNISGNIVNHGNRPLLTIKLNENSLKKQSSNILNSRENLSSLEFFVHE